MKNSILPLIFIGLLPFNSLAQESRMDTSKDSRESERFLRVDASLATIAPTWAGPQIGLLINNRVNVFAGFGSMPRAYVDGLDNVMKQNGSSSRERDLATAAIRDNKSMVFGAEYHFSGLTGWKLGFAAQRLTATGGADLRQFANDEDQAMANTAGNVLNTFGYETAVDSDITMNLQHAYVGYAWSLGERWTIGAQIGASHIESSSAKLSTRIAAFNDSDRGRQFLSDKEKELERTLRSDIWSPSLGLSTQVWF